MTSEPSENLPGTTPVANAPGSSQGTITNSRFLGYFGNHLLQYMFLKTYAARHNLRVECPPWIGNYLFGTNDPPISQPWPVVEDPGDRMIPTSQQVFRDCDFHGYFQYHTSYYAPYRDYIRSLFLPTAEIRALVEPGWKHIAERGRTTVGLHIRRNDFGNGFLYITPTSWYVRWLEQIWPTLEDPVLFVASDEPAKVMRDLRAFKPFCGRDMQVSLPKADYYPEFYGLTQCDILAIPNSTFSFVAAMLNSRLQKSVRSILPLEGFADFDPWNDDPLHRKYSVEDFPHIRGVAITRFGRCVRLAKRMGRKLIGRIDRP